MPANYTRNTAAIQPLSSTCPADAGGLLPDVGWLPPAPEASSCRSWPTKASMLRPDAGWLEAPAGEFLADPTFVTKKDPTKRLLKLDDRVGFFI